LRALRIEGRRSVAQIVDGYGIECRPVRDLLVEYFTERAPELDHTSLRSIARNLCRLFWRDLEIHHPGIDSLQLPPQVAQAWKERLAYIRDAAGRPVRPRVNYRSELVFVRAFYEDIARWAADDPARWAPWVAPCPVKAAECTQKKFKSRVKSRMDQRTRTQLPLLPALLRAVEQQRKDSEERISTARSTPAGVVFTAAGQEFQRCRPGQAGRVNVTEVAAGKRRNLTHEEEAAFWSWATVEILRHTGIRIEEMLELTHHSFIAYTLPTTGEIVPMLQVAPSKTDAERLLLVSPELAEVLTAVIFRVRAGNAALPLVCAYDVFEQTWSPPMPFLFQRRYGNEDRPIGRSYIRECMVATSQAAQITAAGETLEWRPHDFRRIFVTDALRSGLPPHIAAKICGHALLDTTMGYAAIYPEDVIAHHRAFIARRRTERPSEEYRDLTDVIRGFQDRQRRVRRSDCRGRVRHRSTDDEASTHLGAVSERTWETARLRPPGVHGPPLMDTSSVAVRPRIIRLRRSGNRSYRPVTRCGGRHSCDPGLPPPNGRSSSPTSSCARSPSEPAAETSGPRARMKMRVSDVHSSGSTRPRCHGWKRSAPTWATGSGRPGTRDGWARSPPSRPPWPPPPRNSKPCVT